MGRWKTCGVLVVTACTLAACDGADAGVSYKPPVLPMECLITLKEISCSIQGSVTTPIGTFGLETDILHRPHEQEVTSPGETPGALIVRHRTGGTVRDTLYSTPAGRGLTVTGNGRFRIDQFGSRTLVDVSDGTTTELLIKDSAEPDPSSKSAAADSNKNRTGSTSAGEKQFRTASKSSFTRAPYGRSTHTDRSYSAEVVGVTNKNNTLTVKIDVRGKSDLRDPTTSCISVTGSDGKFLIHPHASRFTVSTPGHHVGTLTFPLLLTGTYRFQYSCESDYSSATLGRALVPNLGIAAYSERYFAVIFAVRNRDNDLQVTFAAAGLPDLRDPDDSCLQTPSGRKEGTYSSTADSTLGGRFTSGTVTFSDAPKADFSYSCSSGYPLIRVP